MIFLILKKHNLINIWQMFNVAADAINGKTIHPTEIFIAMNLLQMPCMITYVPKNQPLTSKKWGRFLVFNIKNQGQGKTSNQTQCHKVNDFDFCFVPKYFHISNLGPSPEDLISRACRYLAAAKKTKLKLYISILWSRKANLATKFVFFEIFPLNSDYKSLKGKPTHCHNDSLSSFFSAFEIKTAVGTKFFSTRFHGTL